MAFSRFNPGCCCDSCDWYSTGVGLASTNRPVEAYRIYRSFGTIEVQRYTRVWYTGNYPVPPAEVTYEVLEVIDLNEQGTDDTLIMADWELGGSDDYYAAGTRTPTVEEPWPEGGGFKYSYSWINYHHNDTKYESAIVFRYERGDKWPTGGAMSYFNGIIGNKGSLRLNSQISETSVDLDEVTGGLLFKGDVDRDTSIRYSETAPDPSWFDTYGPGDPFINQGPKIKYGYTWWVPVRPFPTDENPTNQTPLLTGSGSEYWVVFRSRGMGTEALGYDAASYSLDGGTTGYGLAHESEVIIPRGDLGPSAVNWAFHSLPTDEVYDFDKTSGHYTSRQKAYDGQYIRARGFSYNNKEYPGWWTDGDSFEYGLKDGDGNILLTVKITFKGYTSYNRPIDNTGETTLNQTPGDSNGGTLPLGWYYPYLPERYQRYKPTGSRILGGVFEYEIGGSFYDQQTGWLRETITSPALEVDPVNRVLLPYPPTLDLVIRDGSVFVYQKTQVISRTADGTDSIQAPLGWGSPMASQDDEFTLNHRVMDLELGDVYWYVKPGDTYGTVDHWLVQNEADVVECGTGAYDGIEYPYSVPQIKAEVTSLPDKLAPEAEFDVANMTLSSGVVDMPVLISGVGEEFDEETGFLVNIATSLSKTRDYPVEQPLWNGTVPLAWYGPTGGWTDGVTVFEEYLLRVRPTGSLVMDKFPWKFDVTRSVVDQTEDTVTLSIEVNARIMYQPGGAYAQIPNGDINESLSSDTPDTADLVNPVLIEPMDRDEIPRQDLETLAVMPPPVEYDQWVKSIARNTFFGYNVVLTQESQVGVPSTITDFEDRSDDRFAQGHSDPGSEFYSELTDSVNGYGILTAAWQILRGSQTLQVTITRGQEQTLEFRPMTSQPVTVALNTPEKEVEFREEVKVVTTTLTPETMEIQQPPLPGGLADIPPTTRGNVMSQDHNEEFRGTETSHALVGATSSWQSQDFSRSPRLTGGWGFEEYDFSGMTFKVTIDGDW